MAFMYLKIEARVSAAVAHVTRARDSLVVETEVNDASAAGLVLEEDEQRPVQQPRALLQLFERRHERLALDHLFELRE